MKGANKTRTKLEQYFKLHIFGFRKEQGGMKTKSWNSNYKNPKRCAARARP